MERADISLQTICIKTMNIAFTEGTLLKCQFFSRATIAVNINKKKRIIVPNKLSYTHSYKLPVVCINASAVYFCNTISSNQ